MSGIDRDRLAEAIATHLRNDRDGWHRIDDGCAHDIALQYDRLTAEWREKMRAVLKDQP